jgi:hypothetical protein
MQSEQLVALVVIGASVLLYMRHRNGDPAYSTAGYENVTPMKHDLMKQTTLDLMPLLVFGLTSDGELWNSENPLNSKLGRMGLTLLAYVVYYQLVEPYIANRTPLF